MTLGRIWSRRPNAPGTTENTTCAERDGTAGADRHRRNGGDVHQPGRQCTAHGAVSFFDHEFDSGTLPPGQSYTHTFRKAGRFYYNDPVFPQNTGLIIVMRDALAAAGPGRDGSQS